MRAVRSVGQGTSTYSMPQSWAGQRSATKYHFFVRRKSNPVRPQQAIAGAADPRAVGCSIEKTTVDLVGRIAGTVLGKPEAAFPVEHKVIGGVQVSVAATSVKSGKHTRLKVDALDRATLVIRRRGPGILMPS